MFKRQEFYEVLVILFRSYVLVDDGALGESIAVWTVQSVPLSSHSYSEVAMSFH